MSADTDPRKSPCANTGNDSSKNLHPTMRSHQLMSILLIDPAFVRCRWEDEDRRLEKLWKDTGRKIHRLAWVRHRSEAKEQIGRLCQ
jgi:hypothetical protein